MRSYEHDRLSWAASSLFVIGYSYVISMTVPYFSSLVGIVAGEHVGAAGQGVGTEGRQSRHRPRPWWRETGLGAARLHTLPEAGALRPCHLGEGRRG